MTDNKKDHLTAKLEAIGRARNPRNKRELYAELAKVLNRVEDALFLRQIENARNGRDEDNDDIFAALDMAETMLLQLGVLPRASRRTVPPE
jgi:hypothetical protein